MGIHKERLSQSALVAEMRLVSDAEARASYRWLLDRGMTFRFGVDGTTELTEDQVLDQLRLYAAAVRIADGSAATRSVSSTSRGSRTWRPLRILRRACSTTPTGHRSARSTRIASYTTDARYRTSTKSMRAPRSMRS
jgi:hypothetical protein